MFLHINSLRIWNDIQILNFLVMGSGTNNRKKNDTPIIRRPKIILDVATGNYSMADYCVASFDVKVNQHHLTKKGIAVSLNNTPQGVFCITIGGTEIGQLSAHKSQMIKECGKHGIKYKGGIILKNGGVYARFIRVSE